jgi:hypothetical protein
MRAPRKAQIRMDSPRRSYLSAVPFLIFICKNVGTLECKCLRNIVARERFKERLSFRASFSRKKKIKSQGGRLCQKLERQREKKDRERERERRRRRSEGRKEITKYGRIDFL